MAGFAVSTALNMVFHIGMFLLWGAGIGFTLYRLNQIDSRLNAQQQESDGLDSRLDNRIDSVSDAVGTLTSNLTTLSNTVATLENKLEQTKFIRAKLRVDQNGHDACRAFDKASICIGVAPSSTTDGGVMTFDCDDKFRAAPYGCGTASASYEMTKGVYYLRTAIAYDQTLCIKNDYYESATCMLLK